ncbi:MAG: acetylglutamate kinase [Bacteriovoracaceae bacterium]|nr:acetylglutamate kinase [Bacteriovoracaceae bacterium]
MKTIVVKIGGAALSIPFAWETACKAVAELRSQGNRVIVVHGGGPAINQALKAKNISWDFFEGQRITTPEMIETIEDALWSVNRKLGQSLASLNVPYLGVMGKDGGLLNCVQLNEKLGEVGEVRHVHGSLLSGLMNQGITPLVCPIGHGGNGKGLNVNADWAAARIAAAVGADELVYLTDQKGILDSQSQVFPLLTSYLLKVLVEEGIVTGGMLAKTRSILDAIANNVADVHVIAAVEAVEFAEGSKIGTRCTLSVTEDITPKMSEVFHAIQ